MEFAIDACDTCHKTFMSDRNLYLHIRSVHSGEVKCDICNADCSNMSNLKKHVKAIHLKSIKINELITKYTHNIVAI